MPVETQNTAAGVDFDGTAGAGLFSFAKLDRMPASSRVVLASVGLRVQADPGGAPLPLDSVEVLLVPQNGAAGAIRLLLDRSTGAELTDTDDKTADLFVACNLTLPRQVDGQNWDVRFFTDGKLGNGWAIVDWLATPKPDVSIEDALAP